MFNSIVETYTKSDATLEILIIILGAFILGFVFGKISSSYKKIIVDKNNMIKKNYTTAKKYGLDVKNIDKSIVDTALFNQTSDIDSSKTVDSNKNSTVYRKGLVYDFLDNLDPIKEEEEEVKKIIRKEEKNIFDLDDDILTEKELTDDNFDEDQATNIEIKKIYSAEKIDTSNFQILEEDENNNIRIKKEFSKKENSILKIHKKNIQNDLKKIEGIGPKIEELLNKHNIYSFKDLANTDAYKITDMLANAGTRFQMHNPKTWPIQAELAYTNKWSELNDYQEILSGGKE